MKMATTAGPTPIALGRARLADYLELTKPRVAVLVLFTVAIGALLASHGFPDLMGLLHTLIATALVASGASALNQLLERDVDSRMHRTENRPLPAGRLQPMEVFIFGLALGIAGLGYMIAVGQHAAAGVAGLTFFSYVFLYTPLKQKTTLNTLVGAVPGALPPVIGWTGVTGSVGPETLVLFVILFLWQVPHFLAIAWIYREDYARAGLRMLPVVDRQGTLTGRHMVIYCLALIPASLTPGVLGVAGPLYLGGALILGMGFLWSTLLFTQTHSQVQARKVLRASLLYLPALLALLILDSKSTSIALALWK